MTSDAYQFPVAVALGRGYDPDNTQERDAINWLLDQPGASLIVVTPTKDVRGIIEWLVKQPGVTHVSASRSLSVAGWSGHGVLVCWPSKAVLNALWDARPDALAVIEGSGTSLTEWLEDARPIQLLPGGATHATPATSPMDGIEPLQESVESFLESIGRWAAGYSTGPKWNEEAKVKADMMNRPSVWRDVTGDQLRAKCRSMRMRPDDVDTICGFLQRVKGGHRLVPQSGYRDFKWGA
ncbi:MAG: hypothetical protein LBV06_06115 [Propionibacteriaceae bacterium]|jgi:hypothetical protein|nr:hypothetical protein [Propionibacteriaceae bacterium]